MAPRHRIFRVALALSLLAQAILVAAIGYLNCGATGPVDGSPDCRAWVPVTVLPVLPTILRSLALPAILVVPQFFPVDHAFIPAWLHEWTWLLILCAVNVLAWTAGLGFVTTAISGWVTARRVSSPAP
jgi:hypothetical protein